MAAPDEERIARLVPLLAAFESARDVWNSYALMDRRNWPLEDRVRVDINRHRAFLQMEDARRAYEAALMEV